METYILILFFIIGAIMGSFYHVVATRLSNDESIIKPGSHCPKCNHFLSWYENIPIISYILLKGKCKKCHSKIPISYWVVEVVTGLLFSACYHSFGLSVELLIALVFVSSLIIVIVSDIEYMIILDEVLIASSLIIILIYIFGVSLEEAAYHIYAGIGAFIAMYALKILGDKAFKKESLGGGDIKLMFLFGLVLGFPMSICTIFLATFIAFPVAILILFSNKENIIPFGPFLSMAAILLLVSKFSLTDI
ncbi:MAG: prepilin peptidase [Erysipelotrichaceae bacterium]|nr:prepilin peptidase [Erysipelotrichaceae bacterium]